MVSFIFLSLNYIITGHSNFSNVPFIRGINVIEVTKDGLEYEDKSLGLRISIPNGAFPANCDVNLQIGMAMYGPFEFPSNTSPISPILMINPSVRFLLEKPMHIQLPHIIDEATTGDIETLGIKIMKAPVLFSHCQYKFEDIKEDLKIELHKEEEKSYISFSISHFCFIAVLKNQALREDIFGTSCCVFPMCPSETAMASGEFSYHLSVTYYIEPCITV